MRVCSEVLCWISNAATLKISEEEVAVSHNVLSCIVEGRDFKE